MSTLTITTIQTALHWQNRDANLQMLEDKIILVGQKTELVVLPEMFNSGFTMEVDVVAEAMDGETIQWMKRIAAERKIILTGSLVIKENDNYYNRLVWMLPNGQMGWYDKRHLFAYAGEDRFFTRGNKRLIASVKGWKINLMICYDLRFPVWARQASTDGNEGAEYDVLIYVANWPEKRVQMWKTLLNARAIENQAYCIGVNRVGTDGNDIYYSGDSMIINALGETLYQKSHEEDTFTFTLHKEDLLHIREKMPFLKDSDPFLIIQQ